MTQNRFLRPAYSSAGTTVDSPHDEIQSYKDTARHKTPPVGERLLRSLRSSKADNVRRRSTARNVTGSSSAAARLGGITPLGICVSAVHAQQYRDLATVSSSTRRLGRSQSLPNNLTSGVGGIRIPGNSGMRPPQKAVTLPVRRENGARPWKKANLRRKRVATMRSVNGWVREIGAGSTTATLQSVPHGQRRFLPGGDGSSGRSRRRPRENQQHREGTGTFITALETERTPRKGEGGDVETEGAPGDDIRDARFRSNHDRSTGARRKSSVENMKLWGKDGRVTAASKKRRGRQGVRSSDPGRPPPDSHRTATERGTIGGGTTGSHMNRKVNHASIRSRGGWGSKSMGALHRRHPAGLRRFSGNEASPVSAWLDPHQESVRSGGTVAGAMSSSLGFQPPVGVHRQDIQEETPLVTSFSADPLPVYGAEDYNTAKVIAPDLAGDQAALMSLGSTVGSSGLTMAPAWSVLDSRLSQYPFADAGIQSSASFCGHYEPMAPPLSAWQQLRGVEDPTGRSAQLLQDLENKVYGPRKPTDGGSQAVSGTNAGRFDHCDRGEITEKQRPGTWRESTPTATVERLSSNGDRFTTPGESTNGKGAPRQSLPSLFTDPPNYSALQSPLSSSRPPTAASAVTAVTMGASNSRRRRQSSLSRCRGNDETIGRMQRLNAAPRTVGEAWGGGRGGGADRAIASCQSKPPIKRVDARNAHEDLLRPSAEQLNKETSSAGEKCAGQPAAGRIAPVSRAGIVGSPGHIARQQQPRATGSSGRCITPGGGGWLTSVAPRSLLHVGSAGMFSMTTCSDD